MEIELFYHHYDIEYLIIPLNRAWLVMSIPVSSAWQDPSLHKQLPTHFLMFNKEGCKRRELKNLSPVVPSLKSITLFSKWHLSFRSPFPASDFVLVGRAFLAEPKACPIICIN